MGLIQRLASHSENVVVMTHVAANLLSTVYDVSGPGVRVIPHGVPGVPSRAGRPRRIRLGLGGRMVICTFGLINRGKGLGYMIQAMPQI